MGTRFAMRFYRTAMRFYRTAPNPHRASRCIEGFANRSTIPPLKSAGARPMFPSMPPHTTRALTIDALAAAVCLCLRVRTRRGRPLPLLPPAPAGASDVSQVTAESHSVKSQNKSL